LSKCFEHLGVAVKPDDSVIENDRSRPCQQKISTRGNAPSAHYNRVAALSQDAGSFKPGHFFAAGTIHFNRRPRRKPFKVLYERVIYSPLHQP
jgi:hypothetical protein